MNNQTSSLDSSPMRATDLHKDTETRDTLVTLFDPQVVAEFLKNAQCFQNQEDKKEDQSETNQKGETP